jgi:selenocysteine lyase/cysteine desulfurase
MKRSDFFKGIASTWAALTLSRGANATPLCRLIENAGRTGDDALWQVVRDQFILDPDWVYLNFGGLGSMPLPVINSYQEWSKIEEKFPGAHYDEKAWASLKEKLARFLGRTCRKENLALIGTATEGLNMIVNGLSLAKGDEVITSTHEHVALKCALLNRMQRDGIVLRLFDPDLKDGRGNVDRIAGLINSRTRLIIISHVTCTTGQQFPVKEIAALAQEKGIWFALDGAQVPVCVPFDIVECGADFYTASMHKWMMGPKRTGFLYVREGMFDVLRPITAGAGGSPYHNLKTGVLEFEPCARRFEYGTQNEALFYAVGTAIDFVEDIGLDRVLCYSRGLAEKFYAGLREIPGVEILSPEEEAYRSPITSFRLPGRDLDAVNDHFNSEHIRVRVVSENDLNCLRASFFICNSYADVERILSVVKKLV